MLAFHHLSLISGELLARGKRSKVGGLRRGIRCLKGLNSFSSEAWERWQSVGAGDCWRAAWGVGPWKWGNQRVQNCLSHVTTTETVYRGSWINVWANIFSQKNDLKHQEILNGNVIISGLFRYFFKDLEHTQWEIILIIHHCIHFYILNIACRSVLDKSNSGWYYFSSPSYTLLFV